MKRRRPIEINAGSMADIAFLSLLFFLVAATIIIDTGIIKRLPPEYKGPSPPINKRNALIVLINKNDKLYVQGEILEINQLKQKTKEFIKNEYNDKNLPELTEINVEYFGNIKTTLKHVISLQNDRGTSYNMYIKVQNELAAAYNELRNEIAVKRFGTKLDNLDESKKKAILKIYPNHISEAEPKEI